jgi:hypothetical protein
MIEWVSDASRIRHPTFCSVSLDASPAMAVRPAASVDTDVNMRCWPPLVASGGSDTPRLALMGPDELRQLWGVPAISAAL